MGHMSFYVTFITLFAQPLPHFSTNLSLTLAQTLNALADFFSTLFILCFVPEFIILLIWESVCQSADLASGGNNQFLRVSL